MCPARMTADARCARGFTITELMVVIAIATILLMVAAPTFQSTIENSKVGADAKDLVDLFKEARSAAITAGRPVSICVTANGTDCLSSGGAWNMGRIAYYGDTSVVTPTVDDTIARRDYVGTTRIDENNPLDVAHLTFGRTGFFQGSGAARQIRFVGASGAARRCLTLSATGIPDIRQPVDGAPAC